MTKKKVTCRKCNKAYTPRGLTRHLQSCLGDPADDRRSGYHLKITSAWDDYSKLHVLLDRFASLEPLDAFLRRTWLECCGHLSSFNIGDVRYEAGLEGEAYHGWGEPPRPLSTKAHKVLEHGLDFGYIYDFGSTTELELSCYGLRPWPQELEVDSPESTENVVLLARNPLPDITCYECDEEAKWLCPQCQYGGVPMCQQHADDHGCGDYYLPVVNSPRMGVCGYIGF